MNKRLAIAGIAAGSFFVLIIGVGIGASGNGDDDITPATTTTTEETDTPTPVNTTAPTAQYLQPKPEDFTINVIESSRECFGSAGCIVTFDIEAGWPDGYDPSVTYDVTYEIVGGESTYQQTMQVHGDTFEAYQDESISTAADVPLKANVLSVREA